MKTKNVLLGLALGAFVLFSCNRQAEKSEIGQPKLSGKEKVAYHFKHERDERSREESRASIEDFASWTKEEYDLYVDLQFEQLKQAPGMTAELVEEKKKYLYDMLNFGLELFGKYPYAFTPEEWNVFDKEYSKKKIAAN